MIEIALQTKLVIAIITFIVFYFLTNKTIKNISSTNDDDDTIINLDKISKRDRKKNGD
tara:strand:- start:1347 stop:1520 length:174 start_codon:yes stop_codon:yes gene_type:complete